MTASTSSIVAVIPARWKSTRFPGKMLHLLAGRPLIEHVWRRCSRALHLQRVIIATDSERIATVAKNFGAEVIMTSENHQSGTDRVAEVATLLEKEKIFPSHFINVQGDEPLLEPKLIERFARFMAKSPDLQMVTAATPLRANHQNPNLVKVVLDCKKRALYFSRAPLPFHRDQEDRASIVQPLLHLGIYGFRADTLKRFVSYQPSPLECCEKLEQLRALEYGIPIDVIITNHRSHGVDTPADALALEKIITKKETC